MIPRAFQQKQGLSGSFKMAGMRPHYRAAFEKAVVTGDEAASPLGGGGKPGFMAVGERSSGVYDSD